MISLVPMRFLDVELSSITICSTKLVLVCGELWVVVVSCEVIEVEKRGEQLGGGIISELESLTCDTLVANLGPSWEMFPRGYDMQPHSDLW